MTREEFLALPPALALAVLYDGNARIRELVDGAEKPSVPRPPKYDMKVSRREGFCWASEMTLSDLEWWHTKKVESAESGGQYAEKDGKVADKLAFWVRWRRVEPTAPWSGVRDNDTVTAPAPAGKATVHPWPDRGPVTTPLRGEDYGSGNDGDELPF